MTESQGLGQTPAKEGSLQEVAQESTWMGLDEVLSFLTASSLKTFYLK